MTAVSCPHCDASLEFPRIVVGAFVKCCHCTQTFRLSAEYASDEDRGESPLDEKTQPQSTRIQHAEPTNIHVPHIVDKHDEGECPRSKRVYYPAPSRKPWIFLVLATICLGGGYYYFVWEEDHAEQRMKAIGQASYDFLLQYASFPYAVNFELNKQGKPVPAEPSAAPPRLSWRVHLLPFLNHTALYQEFHLDEAWDSPHNIQLLSKMPEIYRSRYATKSNGLTRFQLFTTRGTRSDILFHEWGLVSMADVRDGGMNTALIAETGADRAVPWTQPIDMIVDPQQPYSCLGTIRTPSIAITTMTAEFHWIRKDLPNEILMVILTAYATRDPNSFESKSRDEAHRRIRAK